MPSSSSSITKSSNAKQSLRRNMRRKRSLSFANSVGVRLIPTHVEMSDAEYCSVYYTDVEYQTMKEATLDDVRELRHLHSIQGLKTDAVDYATFLDKASADFCHRGIEHLRTAETNQHRRQTRRMYVYAVLAEQEIQYAARYHEPTALSRVASNFAEPSRIEAIRKGGADAVEARRVSGMSDKMIRALQALHDAADLDDALANENNAKTKQAKGSKLSTIRSVCRPLGSVRMSRRFSQNAAVA